MFDLWKEALNEEDRDRLLEKAAEEISKRKLETPAILFLEMHKPLAYVGSHAALAFSPFLVPFMGFDAVNDYSRLLSDRQNIERLIQMLEKSAKGSSTEEAQCNPS
ncbi:MAG TPA: hypothetical protein VHE55_18395 [Fimbriimonadaceae bacterium]|nr:hypothetical protein [Fimbriimonadaceae bacterium]